MSAAADMAQAMQAAVWATRAHDGQRRKGPAGAPYAVHVFEVARLVATHAEATSAMPIAAILHDSVEDSATTIAEIEAGFGAEVAAIVDALTDAPGLADLPLDERKRRQAEKMRSASPEARIVKLADQTANLRDLAASGEAWDAARCRRYIDGAAVVADACRGLAPALDTAFDTALSEAETWLAARKIRESAA